MNGVRTINPSTLREALREKARKNVRVVAGGTDVLVKLHDTPENTRPSLLVLENLNHLKKIRSKGNKMTVGPLVTFSEIEHSKVLRRLAPQLAEAASVAGSPQIRNRATIGGNLVNGSPAGDLIPPLYVLEAKLELSSLRGKRQVAVADFFVGPGATVLRKHELITSVSLTRSGGHGFFLRLATRRALAVSKVSVAADLSLQKGSVAEVKIALGAVAPTVIRASRAEEFLLGKRLTEETIMSAAKIAMDEAKPIDDIRSEASYRREMVGVLVKRGLLEIAGSR
jgi:CO/xanthine dehydrogenase FAD-binding subunit